MCDNNNFIEAVKTCLNFMAIAVNKQPECKFKQIFDKCVNIIQIYSKTYSKDERNISSCFCWRNKNDWLL